MNNTPLKSILKTEDLTLHVDLNKLVVLAYEIQNQTTDKPKSKKRKEWGTQQDIQEFMYGKEKTAIPLKEYQTKNKEYRHAFNSWRPLNSQAYEIFNSSSKSADDLKEFAAILEKALEHKQQILALKLFATKREHLDISKMWF